MLAVSTAIKEGFQAPSRMIKTTLKVYFDPPSFETFTVDEDIISINTLEEEFATTGAPFGRISSNELSVALNNIGDKFSYDNISSPFYGKLKPNIKVELFYHIRLYNEIEEEYYWGDVPGGVFYTADWKRSSDAITVNMLCYDQLYTWKDIELSSSVLYTDVTVHGALTLLLDAAGLSGLYTLDSSLLSYTMPYYYFGPNKLITELQRFVSGYGCRIYVDKEGKLVVKKARETVSVLELDDQDSIFTSELPPDNVLPYDTVNLDYHSYELLEPQLLASADLITGSNKVKSDHVPVAHLLYVKSKEIVTSISYDHAEFEVIMPSPSRLEFWGQPLKQIPFNTSKTDSTLNFILDGKEIKVQSTIIQDQVESEIFCTLLLNSVILTAQELLVYCCGNPALELGDVVYINDASNKINALYHIRSMKHIYDGSIEGYYHLIRIP